jgi:SAM-dependent methyltransferase
VQILNPDVRRHLQAGLGLRLNLGSGQRRLPGFFNLDCVPLCQPDILADLNAPLTELPDNSVEEVYARHTLEHVDRFLDLLGEIHRVTRPGGRIEIVVPHFSNPYGYSDPTHVRFFGLYSFHYFCDTADQPKRKVPNFYCPCRFRVESVRFNLLKQSFVEKASRALLQPLINRSVSWLDWYERRLCRLLPVNDVRYVLRPVKSVNGLEAGSPPARRAA